MSKDLWRQIEEKLNEHSYMNGVERTLERIRHTAEIFTPTPLVLEMLRYLDPAILGPRKTVLDPACGDGQFLVAAKWFKILHHGMTEEDALRDLYGVDIMRDNVDICRRRLGGGTIVMGDSLAPDIRLVGQSESEHNLMIHLFHEPGATLPRQPRRRARVSSAAATTSIPEQMLF